MSDLRTTMGWAARAAFVAVSIWALVAFLPSASGPSETASALLMVGSSMTVLVLGQVVTARRPENPIGRLLQLTAVSAIAVLWSSSVSEAIDTVPGALNAVGVVVLSITSILLFLSLFLLLYLFPTGTFLSPRWRRAALALSASMGLLPLTTLFASEIRPSFEDAPWSVDNPIGFLPVAVEAAAMTFIGPVVMLLVVGGVASMIVRFRRADVVERTQIKWVLYAGLVTIVAFPLGISDIEVVNGITMMITLTAIPLAVAAAITRYKLFEIDRIISRTITYAVVVGLLAVVFAAGVVWIPSLLDLGESELAVAGTTLGVTAIFNPLRRRVQRVVDRRFNRSNYDASDVIDEFATRIRECISVGELTDSWKIIVDRHLEPELSTVWLASDEVGADV